MNLSSIPPKEPMPNFLPFYSLWTLILENILYSNILSDSAINRVQVHMNFHNGNFIRMLYWKSCIINLICKQTQQNKTKTYVFV